MLPDTVYAAQIHDYADDHDDDQEHDDAYCISYWVLTVYLVYLYSGAIFKSAARITK